MTDLLIVNMPSNGNLFTINYLVHNTCIMYIGDKSIFLKVFTKFFLNKSAAFMVPYSDLSSSVSITLFSILISDKLWVCWINFFQNIS